MKFLKKGEFQSRTVEEMRNVLKDYPEDYMAWVNCADSIYPVTRIQEGCIGGMVGIFPQRPMVPGYAA